MIFPYSSQAMRTLTRFAFGLKLLIAFILMILLGILTTDFFAEASFFVESLRLALLFLCAWMIAARGFQRTGAFFGALALFAGFSGAGSILSMILAASAFPYVDGLLARADAWLFGKDFAANLLGIERQHPMLMYRLSGIYQTLNIQPLLLILYLSWADRAAELARFVHAWAIALLMTLLVFPFAPAVGFYVHHGIEASSLPGIEILAAWTHLETLAALRSGVLRAIDGHAFHGIITFPSFHAASAVILAWGFWQNPLLRWPMALLNMLMMMSAIPIGGHYVVDLIGGTVVAVIAIRLSRTVATAFPASQPVHRPFPSSPNPLWLR